MTRIETVICIGCPMGCEIKLTVGAKGEITKISGNRCKEGKSYAPQEYKNPVRILTATVKTANSSRPLLPVRSARPILKRLLLPSMPVLAGITVTAPVRVGDVVVPNLLDTGVDVIATGELLS